MVSSPWLPELMKLFPVAHEWLRKNKVFDVYIGHSMTSDTLGTPRYVGLSVRYPLNFAVEWVILPLVDVYLFE